MGEITPDILMHAYGLGVFPMSESREDPEIFWVDPKQRGILPLDGFHLSRSLSKSLRRLQPVVTVDHAFEAVLTACADRSETWINDTIHTLYMALYHRGEAHSLEVWHDQRLIGGVYGVTLGAAFFGESMFSAEKDGSKIALAYLTRHLQACGFTLFDTQFITDHLASLGAVEIPRASYQRKLKAAILQDANILSRQLPSLSDVLSA